MEETLYLAYLENHLKINSIMSNFILLFLLLSILITFFIKKRTKYIVVMFLIASFFGFGIFATEALVNRKIRNSIVDFVRMPDYLYTVRINGVLLEKPVTFLKSIRRLSFTSSTRWYSDRKNRKTLEISKNQESMLFEISSVPGVKNQYWISFNVPDYNYIYIGRIYYHEKI